MIVMAVICIALIVLQKREFSIMRFVAGLCAVVMCLLCLINTDYIVVNYNAERYMNGTLPSFDTEILYRAGSAGVPTAEKLYDWTADDNLRYNLQIYFKAIERDIADMQIPQYSLESIFANTK